MQQAGKNTVLCRMRVIPCSFFWLTLTKYSLLAMCIGGYLDLCAFWHGLHAPCFHPSYTPLGQASFLLFVWIFIGVIAAYNLVLFSAVQQSESAMCIHIYPFFFGFSSHLGHHRALSKYIYMSFPISQFIHSPPLTHFGVGVFVLYVCLCFCFANRFIWTIFLDSTYMH